MKTELYEKQHELFIETLLELREAKSKIEQLECELGHLKMEGNLKLIGDLIASVNSAAFYGKAKDEPQYRMLGEGEVVQLGDEVLIDGEWIVVPAYVGVTVVKDTFRRPIKSNEVQDGHGNTWIK